MASGGWLRVLARQLALPVLRFAAALRVTGCAPSAETGFHRATDRSVAFLKGKRRLAGTLRVA
jgi:hypothetical protein